MRDFHVLLSIPCLTVVNGKLKWTLDIITDWPSFGSSNLHKPFLVIVDQIMRNFAPFLSFQWCSWGAWCKSLCWGHTKASQSGGGEESTWLSRRHIYCCWFTPVLWVFVPLHHQTSVELQLVDRWPYVLLQNAQINVGIHFSVDDSKTQQITSTMAPPEIWSLDVDILCLFFPPLYIAFFSPNNFSSVHRMFWQ